MKTATHYALALCYISFAPLRADTFGSEGNAFTIDFVDIGNAGNADDAGAGGGAYSSPYGGVRYGYRMGVTEVPQDWINKATNLGLTNVTAGAWAGDRPAANLTWYEAAAYINWLNTSTGHQAAYNLNAAGTALTLWSRGEAWQLGGENLFRHKDAYYFMPSEDEWYKAAYHKNDGVTANYWDYATAGNTAPTSVAGGTAALTAVYKRGSLPGPAAVNNNGGLSAYGTRGQLGNVWELQESAWDGVNDSSVESRPLRGGQWSSPDFLVRSSDRVFDLPTDSGNYLGLRVASVVPEPTPLVAWKSIARLPGQGPAVRLTWPAVSGRAYDLESSATLAPPWLPIPGSPRTAIGAEEFIDFIELAPTATAERFFRVRQRP